MNQYSNTVKGLSIATIVLSALWLCIILFGLVFAGIGNQVLDSSIAQLIFQLQNDPEMMYDLNASGMTVDQLVATVQMVYSVIWILLLFELIAAVVSLLAGIFGVTGSRIPERFGRIFGWSLAGAILAFLSGRIITMIILIILTVFAHKAKTAAAAATQAQNVYYQPVYQQAYQQAGQPQGQAPDYVYGYDPATNQYVAMNANGTQPYAAQPETYAQPIYAAEAQPVQPVMQQPTSIPEAQPAAPQPETQPVPQQPAAPASAPENKTEQG